MKKHLLLLSAFFTAGCFSVFAQDVQNSLHFDGVDDFAQSDYQGIQASLGRTVEAWIKTTANANPNDGGVQQVICDWGTFVTGGRFTFNVLWGNAIRLEIGGNGVSGTIPVNDGQWHHVAGVYDPTSINRVKLYVDGVLDTEGNFTVTMNTVLGTDVRIGKRIDDVNHFGGQIDEVRVWFGARSQEEIAADMNAEYCDIPQALQLYYTCNQGVPAGLNSGENTLLDGSGSGFDASLINFNLFGTSSNYLEGAPLEIGVTTTNVEVDACESYYWEEADNTYTESGEYGVTLTSINDCDSIVNLDLTIHQPEQTTQNQLACKAYFWDATGDTYEQSGEYMATLENIYGCDSTVFLNLELGQPNINIMSLEACDSLTWSDGVTYYESGTFADTLTNIYGCDSINLLSLSIDHIDNGVSDLGSGLLSSDQENANYQWLDCDDDYAVMNGENDQQFQVVQTGNYAVAVWSDICEADTSDCVNVIITDVAGYKSAGLIIYPNPFETSVQIRSSWPIDQIRVWDSQGRNCLEVRPQETFPLLDLSQLPSGVYVIEVVTIHGIREEVLIKE